MNLIIFAVLALVVGVFAALYVRKARKRMRLERERKMQIADGVFVNEPPAVRKRAWYRPWSGNQQQALPAGAAASLVTELSRLVEQLLAEFNAQAAASAKVKESERECRAATIEREHISLPSRVDAGNAEQWLQQTAATYLKEQRAMRQYRLLCDQFPAHEKRIAEAVLALQKRAWCPANYTLPPDVANAIRTGRNVVDACKALKEHGGHLVVDRCAQPPETPDPQLQEMLEHLSQAVHQLLLSYGEALRLQAEGRKEYALLTEVRKTPELLEPQRPTEGDVQTFLNSVLEWSKAIHTQKAAAYKTVEPLETALQALDSQLALVDEQIAALANEIELRARPFKPQPPEPTQNGLAKPGKRESESDAESATGFTAVVPRTVLTDEQHALLHTLRLATNSVRGGDKAIASALSVWYRQRTTKKTDEVSEAEARKLAAIRAAMRKLVFAVAQRNAASAKLSAESEKAAEAVEPEAPELDEDNAEDYIRSHRRWCKDTTAAKTASQARSERMASAKQQLTERTTQVYSAALSLRPLLETADSLDFRLAVRMAGLLFQMYQEQKKK